MRWPILILVGAWPASGAFGSAQLDQALLVAAKEGRPSDVVALLKQGADPNARDEQGNTPLMLGEAYTNNPYGSPVVCERSCKVRLAIETALIEHGADFTLTNSRYWTPWQNPPFRAYYSWMDGAVLPSRDEDDADRTAFTRLFRASEVSFVAAQEAGASLPSAAQEAFDRGLLAAREQAWETSIRYFDQARRAAPYRSSPLFNLGLAEAHVPGRELRAACWLEASLAVSPHRANAAAVRDQIAELEVRSEVNRDKILGLFKSVVEREDKNWHGFSSLEGFFAIALARSGDIDGAIAVVQAEGDSMTPQAREIFGVPSNGLEGLGEGLLEAPEIDGGPGPLLHYPILPCWHGGWALDARDLGVLGGPVDRLLYPLRRQKAQLLLQLQDLNPDDWKKLKAATSAHAFKDLPARRLTGFMAGPVERADVWQGFVEEYLSGPIFTDFQNRLAGFADGALPSFDAQTPSNVVDAEKIRFLQRLEDQVDQISYALDAIRALRAAQDSSGH